MTEKTFRYVVACWAFFALSLILYSMAHAQGTGPIDPTHPVVAVQTTASLVAHYGFPWAMMFLVFGVGSWFVSRNDAEHWLAQGRVLHLISGGVGVLGAVLDARFNGGSWNSVFVLFPGVLALLLEKPQSAAKAALLLMFLIPSGAGLTACSSLSQVPAQAKACVVAQAEAAYPKIVADITQLVESGSPALEAYLDGLLIDAAQIGLEGGAGAVVCIVNAVESDLMSKAKASPGPASPEAVGLQRLEAWKQRHQ